MAQRRQQGWLKKETRIQGETWVLYFRTTRKFDSRRVENKIPIGFVRDFPDKSSAWAKVETTASRAQSGGFATGCDICRRGTALRRSAPPNEMTPWLGLQLEGLHYAQTGVIQHTREQSHGGSN